MARLAYYAPGVYVEEIPSARQPIAGVGTNTVGFIGIVPDTIYIPVPNPDYDPVLSEDLLELARLSALATLPDFAAEQQRQADITALQDDVKGRMELLDKEIKALGEKKSVRDTKVSDADAALKDAVAAVTNLSDDATPAEAAAKAKSVLSARTALTAANTEAADATTLAAQKAADRKNIGERFAAVVKAPLDPAAEQKRQDDRKARKAELEKEIKALADKKPGLDKKVIDADAALKAATAAEAALPAGATPAETAARTNAVTAARQALTTANTDSADATKQSADKAAELKDIDDQLAAAANPQPVLPVKAIEMELDDYAGKEPDAAMLQKSILRPYYLEPFKVKADEFATKLCTNFSEYTKLFGDFSAFGKTGNGFAPLQTGHHLLTHALNGFFTNGGTRAFVARIKSIDGLPMALERFTSIEDVALLAAPGLPKTKDVWEQLQSYCEEDVHQNVFGILDSPAVVNDGVSNDFEILKLQYETLDNLLPRKSTHAAYYFPHIEVSDPAKRLQDSDPARRVPAKYRGRTHVAPSGHVAGIIARTDEERGVHKAPANATVRGALEVKYYVSKPKQEMLNPQGVNCIRLMNGDVTLWGARTIGGDRNGEWKYVSVRRFAGFLEASIDRGTQWVVFEPNDPRLWSKIILNISAFLTDVWRGGALFGLTPQEAFYVKCDAELNPIEVRDMGWVVTEIGVSIVRPAEFVIFRISQSVGAQQG